MLRIDGDPPATASLLPQESRLIVFDSNFGAMPDRKIDSQAENGDLSILFLASAFRGFPLDAGRRVRDHDRRFDFVAMLPTGPATTLPPNFALGEQFGLVEHGWVSWEWRHAL